MKRTQEQMEKIGFNPFFILILIVVVGVGYVGVGLVNTYLISPDPTPEETTTESYTSDISLIGEIYGSYALSSGKISININEEVQSHDLESEKVEIKITLTLAYRESDPDFAGFRFRWTSKDLWIYAIDSNSQVQAYKRYTQVDLTFSKAGESEFTAQDIYPEYDPDILDLSQNADEALQCVFEFTDTFIYRNLP